VRRVPGAAWSSSASRVIQLVVAVSFGLRSGDNEPQTPGRTEGLGSASFVVTLDSFDGGRGHLGDVRQDCLVEVREVPLDLLDGLD
jgi:hypothetical protein